MNFEENIALFLEEGRDLLAGMETSLVELEKNPDDTKLINEVFRALHTLKGSGAMFGLQKVSEFTHSLENLFDEVRKGTISVDSRIIDIGLRSVDCISSLLDRGDGGEDRLRILADIEKICAAGQPEAAASAAPQSGSAPIEAEPQDDQLGLPRAWRIFFKPRSDILHRGVCLEPLFRELAGLGSCHFTAITAALPDLSLLDPTALYLAWDITLSTSQGLSAIKSVFMFVEDYSELSITSTDIEAIRHEQKPFGEAAVAERETRHESATVRVKKEKLDSLIDLVGELVILQARLELEAKKIASGIFESISEDLAHLTANLRDSIMGIRMVPLEESFASFQRLVRDLSKSVGKELALVLSGGDTELDKNVIELLTDPLVHIIRNSADHGIELPSIREKTGKPRIGTISIGAVQLGSHVEITIADDGAGLDMEKILARAVERKLLSSAETDSNKIMSMIFEPGFSTAEKTTDLSGRGVGMDVVKRNIERLRGEVSLKSEAGRGMTVTLSIPLTLVIIEGLLVRIAGYDYVITLSQVEECVDLTGAVRNGGDEGSIINLRGKTIPVISMRENFGIRGTFEGMPRLVIVTSAGMTVGLMVDSVVGRKQVVIKPLSSTIRRIKAISGATILGDGSVALILDIAEIVKAKSVD